MKPLDECLLRKKSEGLVTRGLVLNMDGRNGIDGIAFGQGVYSGTLSDDFGNILRFNDTYKAIALKCDGVFYSFTKKSSSYNALFSLLFDEPYSIQYQTFDTVIKCGTQCTHTAFGNIYFPTATTFQISDGNLSPICGYTGHYTTYDRIHISATISNGMINVYENGVLVHSEATELSYFPARPRYGIGDAPEKVFAVPYMVSGGTAEERTILMGSQRWYSRSLTDKEILQNYNYEKSLGRVD